MSTATDMLAKYLAAEAAVLEGKMVRFGERQMVLEDLPEIVKGRKEWQAKVDAENGAAAGRPSIGGLGYAVARFD